MLCRCREMTLRGRCVRGAFLTKDDHHGVEMTSLSGRESSPRNILVTAIILS